MKNLSVKTKNRILDVAEELFAQEGIDRVSVRQITKAARVNLAAISYHFGGKQDLIAAVFDRRVRPVNEARLEALTEVEKAAGQSPPKVEDILRAFINPAIHCCQKDYQGSTAFALLFGRCLAEPHPEVESMLRKQFEPLVERMDAALIRALPNLSRSDIHWRMKFTFGALHHWLLTREKFSPPWALGTSMEDQIGTLIKFATAGFKAK